VSEEERAPSGVSRRTMIKRIGAAGAVAWVTPVVTSLHTPAFAQSAIEHPECVRATCQTFVPCSSSNTDCVCVSTDQGGFCFPGSTLCSDLQTCPGGSTDECAAGTVCAVDTCCQVGVCVPLLLLERCPRESDLTARNRGRTPTGAGTLGG
jgi:hypothetical protein